MPYGGEKGAEQPIQRFRDVIKSVTAMTDRKTAYLVLAVENQTKVHYAMPVRNMLYDAMQYTKQVEKAIASHRKSGDYREVESNEFLSGFMKFDRLMPVVTLVIYFGPGEWDGPMSIHEMFGDLDEEMLSIVPDYNINLIAPAAIEDGDFNKFKTTLKEVFEFIKYCSNPDKITELFGKNRHVSRLGHDEVDLLNACVNANLEFTANEEVLDLCQAIEILQERAADKREEEVLERSMRYIMDATGWSSDKAKEVLHISDQERKGLCSQE